MNFFTKKLVASGIALTFISLAASPAFAGNQIGTTVTAITQNGPNGGLGSASIFINTPTTFYVAQTTMPTGCTQHSQSVDTIKGFLSIAQAALLSGKGVDIYFNDCNGTHYMYGLAIHQ